MAEILAIKKQKDGSFIAEVYLEEKEHLNLMGHTNDITLFSDKISFVDTNISQRGKDNITKYFLIPRMLRRNLDFDWKVSCQRIDYRNKILFVYVVDKIMRKHSYYKKDTPYNKMKDISLN